MQDHLARRQHPLAGRTRSDALRHVGRLRSALRRRHRHQRAEVPRSAVPSGAENGGRRPARRRRRPRLQQSADRDPRLLELRHRHAHPGRFAPRRHGRSDQGGRARGRPDQAVAGVQPQTGAPSDGDRSQRTDRRDAPDARPADRRRRRIGVAAGARARRRPRRRRTAGAGPDEPGPQRARRDAERRAPVDRNRQRRSRSVVHSRRRRAAGRLRDAGGER